MNSTHKPMRITTLLVAYAIITIGGAYLLSSTNSPVFQASTSKSTVSTPELISTECSEQNNCLRHDTIKISFELEEQGCNGERPCGYGPGNRYTWDSYQNMVATSTTTTTTTIPVEVPPAPPAPLVLEDISSIALCG